MQKLTSVACGFLLCVCVSGDAHAYCRESVDSLAAGVCSDNPNAKDLVWKRSCVTYVFNALVFGRIQAGAGGPDSEAFVRDAFKASFQAWADVPCDGRKPFFVEQSPEVTQADSSEFMFGIVNESVIMVRTAKQWASAPDHDPNSVALTSVWFLKSTGEITDFDMELNSGAGEFADCVQRRCSLGMIDLQNTVTHEAGHVLGLAHSAVPGATMQPSTSSVPETQKRVLEQDDKLGYCALGLPEFQCVSSPCECPPPPVYRSDSGGSSCGCRLAEAPSLRAGLSALTWVTILCGAVAWRSRRRSGRGRSQPWRRTKPD